jgi:phage terminase large subunit-like protein
MTAKLEEILATLEAAASLKTYRKINFFAPYAKQVEFFDLGASKRERLLMAGNQVGKTEAGAFETACHLTGEYPEWWMGKRFTHPTKGWAAGESSTVVRDVQQKKLCGEPGVADSLGTGLIPKDAFVDAPSLARGVTDAYDTIQVKHKTNGKVDGTSILRFKSYEQGRTKFQADTIDFGWPDEEPDESIYSEFLTRLASDGMMFMTFTPLKGMSNVVARFLNEPSPDRSITIMTIDDALHFSAEERAKRVAGYPAHEREARAKGIPMLGSGRIFQISDEAIMEAPLSYIPAHWVLLWGIDFGIGHPFAAVLIAWDKDNDVIHVLHTIRVKDQLPLQHSVPMKARGAAVPVAWPQDGTQRKGEAGESMATLYKKQGLHMLPGPAMWPEGGNSTEAGIMEMQDRMTTGRLKVAAHLSDWFEEFRLYHRKDGLIVKERDDIMSATRIAIMAKRFARAVPLGSKDIRRETALVARDVDFDLD